jgi:hypothetical protein
VSATSSTQTTNEHRRLTKEILVVNCRESERDGEVHDDVAGKIEGSLMSARGIGRGAGADAQRLARDRTVPDVDDRLGVHALALVSPRGLIIREPPAQTEAQEVRL